MKTYTIPQYGITVKVEDIKALESFILALACEGYDISEPKFVAALENSLEAITNHS
jgi:hypothetical protein